MQTDIEKHRKLQKNIEKTILGKQQQQKGEENIVNCIKKIKKKHIKTQKTGQATATER